MSGVWTLTAFASFFAVPPVKAEPFVGQFELKTLESAPGRFEFQSQNAWSQGQPARRIADGPDGLEFDENAIIRERYALELEMGFTRTLKMRVGVELEEERLDEPETVHQANDFGGLSLTELGAEVIAVLRPREGDGAGFGLVVEIEQPFDREESTSLLLGPIIEFQSGRWFAAAIPMFVYAFGSKWDFAYATQVAYTFTESWSLALEGYGTVERLGRTGRLSESARPFGDSNQHRAGPVLYYTRNFGGSRRPGPGVEASAMPTGSREDDAGASLTIGLGLLEGLNANTADHTLKLSIEVDF